MVVKDDDMRIGREPEVAFNARVYFKRSFKGGDAILRNLESGVQAPMSEARRAGVEWVSS